MKRNNLSVKTVLLHEKKKDIETPHISIFNITIAGSTQIIVFSDEKENFDAKS
jgi:hypothetical protein